MSLPIHLDLRGKRVLVVGAGPVGVRRARLLAAEGADVLVVAPDAPPDLELPLARRAFRAEDADGCWLVLACTGVIDGEVAAACAARGIWCGRADDAARSEVWVPAVARHEDIVVSVTAGADPRRAVALRDAIGRGLESGSLPTARVRPGGSSVLLGVAHGSRNAGAQEVVRSLLARTAQLRPGLVTADAYIDNASPSIQHAVAQLAVAGHRDITVVPLLLSAASHSKTDVAASVQGARVEHPGLLLRYARPFGSDPIVVEVLAQRLAEAGAHDLPVVLVAGGSRDPDANAGVAATARLLLERSAFPSVDIAFVSTTAPSVVQALEGLRAQGHSKVALSRFFLGPGYLPRQVLVQAAEVAGVEVVVSEPLGDSELLARVVLARYDEGLTGGIRMNCDACMYRIAYPGRERDVGAPQVPHTHPDD